MQSEASTFNILFVCTGNTCRSPMAEAVARREIERRGWRHVRVASAGVVAGEGEPASELAAAVLLRRGIDVSGHASRNLTAEMVDWADLILVMGHAHLYSVAELGGGEKVALLGQFAAGDARWGPPVPDPFGGAERDYEDTLDELQGLVIASLDRIAPVVQP